MSGTWATIPECLSLAFSLNVVPGNARTEANPLHVAFVSEHPTYEGFNSRAYANPNSDSFGKVSRNFAFQLTRVRESESSLMEVEAVVAAFQLTRVRESEWHQPP